MIIESVPPRYFRSFNAGDERRTKYRKKRAEEWQTAVDEATLGVCAPKGYLRVDITFEIANKVAFRGKLENRVKTTFDALTKSGYWSDDRKVISVTMRKKTAEKSRTIIDVKSAGEW